MGEERSAPVSPYAQWTHGPPTDPNWFPIGVWLQAARNAKRYQKAGINFYVGLWYGPTEEQLQTLREVGMPVICAQNAVGLAHRDDPILIGWMHQDEPDNAQPIGKDESGRTRYGPPVPPNEIVERYRQMTANDPTRPVFLNLGQGVANDSWRGRGPQGHPDDYYTYVKGADIVSFDVYPVAGLDRPDLLWYVAKGVQRLHHWVSWNRSVAGPKIVWNVVECTRISNEVRKPTPHQVRAEVWMSLIHGSQGIVYFVHQFRPTFNESALLDDPEMLAAVTAINRQIRELAPVLNSPTLPDAVRVRSSNFDVPIAGMAKRYGKALYLFAVAMGEEKTEGDFTLSNALNGTAEVLGEDRTLSVREGRFQDTFAGYAVHLYRIRE